MTEAEKTREELSLEIVELRARLEESDEALRAIRNGEVDALVVYGTDGEQVYTLQGAEHAYRVMVEAISEGAATALEDGVLLYCNHRLAEMLGAPLETLPGTSLARFVSPDDSLTYEKLLEKGRQGPYRAELTLQTQSGLKLPTLLSVSPIQVDDSWGLCMIATDLTVQKRNLEVLAAERLSRSILEQAAEAIVVCDTEGIIIRASQSAALLAGKNPLFKPFEQVYLLCLQAPQAEMSFSIGAVLSGAYFKGLMAHLEPAADPGNGRASHLLLSAAPLINLSRGIIGCVITMTDVTEQRQMEAALEKSRERLLLITGSAEVGLWDWDLKTDTFTWDERTRSLFGLPPETPISYELFMNSVFEEDRRRVEDSFRTALDLQKILEVEFRTVWPDGTQRWIYTKGQAVYTTGGNPQQIMGIVMDITSRKEAEVEHRANQARIEAQHYLLEQREQERLKIARDLHDGPVQGLIGTTFSLKSAIEMTNEADLKALLQSALETIHNQIGELRDYAGELRPPTITKFGLGTAIRSHAEEFRERHPDLQVRLQSDLSNTILSESVSVALFRIYQEALNNIVRHAQAKQVTVRLARKLDTIALEVQDDGVGFDPPQLWVQLARKGHLGLVGLQERAEAVGGSVHIHSAPGVGTLVRVVVPFREGQEDASTSSNPS